VRPARVPPRQWRSLIRRHLYGVFAPHSKLRSRVVRQGPPAPQLDVRLSRADPSRLRMQGHAS
jgi:hypothetical protein